MKSCRFNTATHSHVTDKTFIIISHFVIVLHTILHVNTTIGHMTRRLPSLFNTKNRNTKNRNTKNRNTMNSCHDHKSKNLSGWTECGNVACTSIRHNAALIVHLQPDWDAAGNNSRAVVSSSVDNLVTCDVQHWSGKLIQNQESESLLIVKLVVRRQKHH